MSFWSIMNWVVWGLCGLIAIRMLSDFIKVENEARKANKLDKTKQKVD